MYYNVAVVQIKIEILQLITCRFVLCLTAPCTSYYVFVYQHHFIQIYYSYKESLHYGNESVFPCTPFFDNYS